MLRFQYSAGPDEHGMNPGTHTGRQYDIIRFLSSPFACR